MQENLRVRVMRTKGNAERAANVERILPELEQISGGRVEILDAGLDDVFDVFIRCFHLSEGDYGLLLLEDDVLLCRQFHDKVMDQISAHRDEVVSFFEKPMSRSPLHSGHYPGREFGFGTCNYFPARICAELGKQENVDGFRAYWPSRNEKWVYPNDIYIRWVLQHMKEKYYMQIPFLVQHLPFRSALGPRSTRRQTRYFIDDLEG